MKIIKRAAKAYRRIAGTPNHLVISGGVRMGPPRRAWLRNLIHRVKRLLPLLLISTPALAASQNYMRQPAAPVFSIKGTSVTVRCTDISGAFSDCAGSASAGGAGATAVTSTATTVTNAFSLEATQIGIKTGTDRIPAQGQALAAGSLPVVLTASQVATLTPVAGLTDAQIRATALPVSGTFWQAVQAVSQSGAWSVASTLAAETTKIIGTVNIAAGQTIGVTGTFWQATQPVSGTFWQGTQPVSGTFFQATQPVSGSFWQTTQPVSNAGTFAVQAAQSGTWNVTNTGTFITQAAATLTAETTKVIGTVNAPALTKGTQGANGFSTQDLKDAGRVIKTYATVGDTGITGSVAAALVTMTPYADIAAGTPATTFAVTSGKRLRLQQMCVTWRNNTAVVGAVTVRFRMLAGTVLVGSPIQLSLNVATLSAVAGSGQSNCAWFPDGFELSGTMQFGVTQQAQSAVAGFSVEIHGYEY